MWIRSLLRDGATTMAHQLRVSCVQLVVDWLVTVHKTATMGAGRSTECYLRLVKIDRCLRDSEQLRIRRKGCLKRLPLRPESQVMALLLTLIGRSSWTLKYCTNWWRPWSWPWIHWRRPSPVSDPRNWVRRLRHCWARWSERQHRPLGRLPERPPGQPLEPAPLHHLRPVRTGHRAEPIRPAPCAVEIKKKQIKS